MVWGPLTVGPDTRSGDREISRFSDREIPFPLAGEARGKGLDQRVPQDVVLDREEGRRRARADTGL